MHGDAPAALVRAAAHGVLLPGRPPHQWDAQCQQIAAGHWQQIGF